MSDDLYVKEIPFRDPLEAFYQFHSEPFSLFLDSAMSGERQGRFSFIAASPFQTLTCKGRNVNLDGIEFSADPFAVLSKELERFPAIHRVDLPPFQTGVAGYFAYDLNRLQEDIPVPEFPESPFPDLAIGFYDCIAAFDVIERRAWILSSGYPELGRDGRRERARQRADSLRERLSEKAEPDPVDVAIPDGRANIGSNFTRETYVKAVQHVIDYILAGDIFQANLSQRFESLLPDGLTPFGLYKLLRSTNPAPFAGYFNLGDFQILSASPERFLMLKGRLVETRPIKGTRPRGSTSEEDQRLAAELQHSEKDRAENTMIVDLLRNDLSKVCEPHSVKVPELCRLEIYPSVHHLVSTVTGRLTEDAKAVDLLRATFPGGSITGAPKVRAMEIIAELERMPRGPYCGNMGYIGFDGDMDLNILIRTILIANGAVTFQAGGGIVADSNPEQEYLETLHKVGLMFRVLNGRLNNSALEDDDPAH